MVFRPFSPLKDSVTFGGARMAVNEEIEELGTLLSLLPLAVNPIGKACQSLLLSVSPFVGVGRRPVKALVLQYMCRHMYIHTRTHRRICGCVHFVS